MSDANKINSPENDHKCDFKIANHEDFIKKAHEYNSMCAKIAIMMLIGGKLGALGKDVIDKQADEFADLLFDVAHLGQHLVGYALSVIEVEAKLKVN